MSKDDSRPSANTRSATTKRTISVDNLTDIEFKSLDLAKSGIPKPTFQVGKTHPSAKTTQNPTVSEKVIRPCSVLLERLDDTDLQESKPDGLFETSEDESNDELLDSKDLVLAEIARLNSISLIPERSIIPNNPLFQKIPDPIRTMSDPTITITDMINAIPFFEGHQKDMDYFISTCQNYHNMVAEAQRPMFISILQTKFKGIAHVKMQPFADLITWDLEDKFKRPLNYEASQDEISNMRQARGESIEVFGNHIRLALHKSNRASETLTTNADALKSLRKANEKLAIRKFEQNLFNNNLKIWVGAKDFNSLDAAISFAMQKEPTYKNDANIRCNY